MRFRYILRISALPILVGAPALFWVACGGGGGEGLVEPEVGTLEISATTSGPEPDADGYTVAIDGAGAHALGPNGTLRVGGLPSGPHTVALSGAAENCAVAGEGSAAVEVVSGSTVGVSFAIACRPTSGTLEITTSTSANPDPNGYSLLLDGTDRGPIGTEALVVLSGLASGEHSVGLTGLAANCRVEGDNPRGVTVVAGETAALAITVSCEVPPATTGSLRVTTATTGADPDPDGFRFSIDDVQEQPIGSNATVDISGLAAGPHTIRLLGEAANCSIGGDNPRTIDVPAGGIVDVSYAVTCTSATGSLRVTTATTGSPRDPDGYSVSLDGGTGRPIGVNANLTLDGLGSGLHQVALGGVAANCLVQGENPRTVTIAAAATNTTAFEVVCAATTGSLTVTVTGLPDAADADVTVTGPNGFTQEVTETRTLDGLVPGDYTVAAAAVSNGGNQYSPSPETQTAAVSAGETATVSVRYSRASGGSLNLRIEGLYLTQSVQTPAGDVPLVEGRDGYLRVFAVANEANTARPTIRVRLFRNSVLRQTFTLTTSQASTPTTVEEGVLSRSWNVRVPGSLIQRELEIVADVDPDDAVAESDETDNSFPASGGRLSLDVQAASRLRVRLVPIRQRANNLLGDVTEANKGRFLDLTQRVHPIPSYDADIHQVYLTTTSKPLDPDNASGAWSDVLREILAIQVSEGSGRNYYGVVRVGHRSGLAGLGYVGAPAAIGYDESSDASRVMAHELGHNWGRLHSACGNPGDVDPDYPYDGGLIGVHGLDVASETLKGPHLPDVMGYCRDPWVSDFNYNAVLDYRAGSSPAEGSVGGEQRCLLIWGRIENGRAILEPAFEVVTRPMPHHGGGPYSVAGYSADGGRLFEVSFDAVPVADDRRGGKDFAFAVPLDDAVAARLESLRLAGAGILPAAASRSVESRLAGAAADSVIIRPTAGGAALQWDAAAHPMIMVRDPDTGEVLSFARGGRVEVQTGKRALDLVVSDGVRSRHTRLAVPGR